MRYSVGQAVRVSAVFAAGGAATDTAALLRVVPPSGPEADYSGPDITHEGDGAYSRAVVLAEAGEWLFRWEGSGALVGAGETGVLVEASGFP